LDATVEANGRDIHLYRFAQMASIGEAVVVAAEGVTVNKRGVPCYGCSGAPRSLWAYRPPSNAPTAAEVAPVTFAPAQGWNRITTRTDPSEVELYEAPMSWASNEPFSERDLAGHTSGPWLADPILPFYSLQELPPDGVFVTATLYGTKDRADSLTLPLRLSDFQVQLHWEGGPAPGVPQHLLAGTIGGRILEVRVFFGTLHPSEAMLQAAQEELDRLQLPPAP
jgi:hypothetical protein